MRFSYFNIFSRCANETAHEAFRANVAETIYLEQLGYDEVWLAETPLWDPVTCGTMSMTAAAHLAGRTSRIRIGIGIVTMPMHDPLQVAITAATIDHFSEGRFDLGIGRGIAAGIGPRGFEVLGSGIVPEQPPDRYRTQYLESIDCTKGLLDSDRFSFHGEHYTFDETAVAPRPFQDPLPVWVVAASPGTFPEMGARGIHLLIPLPGWQGGIGTWEETADLLGAYRAAWAAGGHAGAPQVVVRIPTFLHQDAGEAREIARRAIVGMRTRFPKQIAGTGLGRVVAGMRAAHALGNAGIAELISSDVSIDELIANITVTGEPELAVDEFRRVQQELGATGIMLEPQFLGQTLREDHLRTLRLVAEEVMPEFP